MNTQLRQWLIRRTWYRGVLLCMGALILLVGALDSSPPGHWSVRSRNLLDQRCYYSSSFQGGPYTEGVCRCVVDSLEARYDARDLDEDVGKQELDTIASMCWAKVLETQPLPEGSLWHLMERASFLALFSAQLGTPAAECLARSLEFEHHYASLNDLPDALWQERISSCRPRSHLP